MKIQILAVSIAILFASCASLSKTQIRAVNQFARTSSNFSAYPSTVIEELAEIRMRRGVYFANSFNDPASHIEDLDGIYSARKSDSSISRKVDITFKVIDKYAQSLVLLSSDEYVTDLEEQAENFGGDLDSLCSLYNRLSGSQQVPTGIGGAVNKLIVSGGKQYIRSKQAEEIKKFVPLADKLIEVMTTNLLEFLQSTIIDELIKNEEREIRQSYLSFLNQRQATIENEWDYLLLKKHFDLVKELRAATVTATRQLRKAHAKLLTEIQEKKTLTETIRELQDLYDDVKDVKTAIQSIKSSKK